MTKHSTAQAQLDVLSSPESSLSWEKQGIMIRQSCATGSCLRVGEEEEDIYKNKG